MNDAELIQAWRDGDDASLEQLLRRYESPIYAYLLRMLGNVHDAEDTTQETFVRVVKALPRYRESGQFKSWVYHIAHREAYRTLRKGMRRAAEVHDDDALQQAESHAVSSHEQAAINEHGPKLEQALAELPDKERSVVLMRAKTDMTFKEIAKAMGCPLNTALSHMRRATQTLSAAIESSLYD